MMESDVHALRSEFNRNQSSCALKSCGRAQTITWNSSESRWPASSRFLKIAAVSSVMNGTRPGLAGAAVPRLFAAAADDTRSWRLQRRLNADRISAGWGVCVIGD